MTEEKIIGLISDTHGLIRPEAIAAFKGVRLIVHAGDVGGPDVLEALGAVAPVIAVRGNNDKGSWAWGLPDTEAFDAGGIRLYLLHNLKELDLDPSAAGFKAVVSGHSHRPSIEEREGVLFVNPGSAGPRRFKLPVSIGYLFVRNAVLRAEVRTLSL